MKHIGMLSLLPFAEHITTKNKIYVYFWPQKLIPTSRLLPSLYATVYWSSSTPPHPHVHPHPPGSGHPLTRYLSSAASTCHGRPTLTLTRLQLTFAGTCLTPADLWLYVGTFIPLSCMWARLLCRCKGVTGVFLATSRAGKDQGWHWNNAFIL